MIRESNQKNYLKEFNKFEEGMEGILSVMPEVAAYTGNVTEEKLVVEQLINQIKNSIPSVYNPEYPATYAFSISAREVGFRTRSNIAFGWKTLINKETNQISYEFRVTIITRNKFINNNTIFAKLEDNGWSEKVYVNNYSKE